MVTEKQSRVFSCVESEGSSIPLSYYSQRLGEVPSRAAVGNSKEPERKLVVCSSAE